MREVMEDILDLDDEDEAVDDEALALSDWRRSAQTAKAKELYTQERDAAIVTLITEAISSSDPKVARAAAKIQTLERVIAFFGGKTKEEEL